MMLHFLKLLYKARKIIQVCKADTFFCRDISAKSSPTFPLRPFSPSSTRVADWTISFSKTWLYPATFRLISGPISWRKPRCSAWFVRKAPSSASAQWVCAWTWPFADPLAPFSRSTSTKSGPFCGGMSVSGITRNFRRPSRRRSTEYGGVIRMSRRNGCGDMHACWRMTIFGVIGSRMMAIFKEVLGELGGWL